MDHAAPPAGGSRGVDASSSAPAPPLALPLAGVRVVEFAGVGPGPFCGMMLADAGAEVIRIDRAGGLGAGVPLDGARDAMLRSRRSITLDLKSVAGAEIARRLCASADGLIEGFRPGVMERLGLGPEVLMAANPALVYGRMTGWGQDGPFAPRAGHDINYLAASGALDAIRGRNDVPLPPLNLLGDFAGGGMMLAFGMVSAILAARGGAPGRVIDCAMAEGASALMSAIWTLRATGHWQGAAGENLLDGGAPFYAAYRTADDRFVTIGAIEPVFYARLLEALDLAQDPRFAAQHDRARWPAMRDALATIFASAPLAAWKARFAGVDACFAAVVTMDEAPEHPHLAARGAFVTVDGVVQPAPVPRFVGSTPAPIAMWAENADRDALLALAGFAPADAAQLAADGAFGALPVSGD